MGSQRRSSSSLQHSSSAPRALCPPKKKCAATSPPRPFYLQRFRRLPSLKSLTTFTQSIKHCFSWCFSIICIRFRSVALFRSASQRRGGASPEQRMTQNKRLLRMSVLSDPYLAELNKRVRRTEAVFSPPPSSTHSFERSFERGEGAGTCQRIMRLIS